MLHQDKPEEENNVSDENVSEEGQNSVMGDKEESPKRVSEESDSDHYYELPNLSSGTSTDNRLLKLTFTRVQLVC